MVNITLCGENNDDGVLSVLKRAQKHYGIFSLKNANDLQNVDNDCNFLIFKNSFKYQKHFLPKSLISIVDSQNKSAIAVLKENNLPTITCGMSFKDTLSVSSLTENKAIASLQRNIKSLDGNIIEPRDLNIELSKKTGIFSILVVVVVLLCSLNNPPSSYQF